MLQFNTLATTPRRLNMITLMFVFRVVKACVGPTTIIRWADDKRMCQNSPDNIFWFKLELSGKSP